MTDAVRLTSVLLHTSLAAFFLNGLCAAAPQAAVGPSAPSLEEIGHASIRGIEEAGGPVTLANGTWEGKPYVEGGASRPSVTLVRNIRLAADLDGDGREEAVALVAGASGGTGETTYVTVLRRTGPRQVESTATAAIGDRVQVRDARLDGRRIVLDLVQAGEKDAACCPGDLVTRTWDLRADRLAEGTPTATGRLGIDALGTGEWVLRSWACDEAAPAAPEVTLKLDGTRLAGSTGCNHYDVASVKSGAMPGDLQVARVGRTRKACPDANMSVERRFTTQLGAVRKLGFMGGQLALSYSSTDGTFGVMLFDRRPTP